MSANETHFIECTPDARYFYAVEFYSSELEMKRAVAKLGAADARGLGRLQACCVRYKFLAEPGKRALMRKHEPIGTLFFVAGKAPREAVTHELTHAALGWARRTGVNPLTRNRRSYRRCPEERFANVVQHLHEEFYRKIPPGLRGVGQ